MPMASANLQLTSAWKDGGEGGCRGGGGEDMHLSLRRLWRQMLH